MAMNTSVKEQLEARAASQSTTMNMAFWFGLVLGGLSALALFATWMLMHSGGH